MNNVRPTAVDCENREDRNHVPPFDGFAVSFAPFVSAADPLFPVIVSETLCFLVFSLATAGAEVDALVVLGDKLSALMPRDYRTGVIMCNDDKRVVQRVCDR